MSKVVIEIDRSNSAAFDEAFEAIGKWIDELKDLPGFKEWKTKQLATTLDYGDPMFKHVGNTVEMFEFPPHILKQQWIESMDS